MVVKGIMTYDACWQCRVMPLLRKQQYKVQIFFFFFGGGGSVSTMRRRKYKILACAFSYGSGPT